MDKQEFPPLLPEGLHPVSLEQLKEMCVTNFPLSSTRERIMIGLERLISELKTRNVCTEVWVDGSFLTEKTNPEDVDLVLCADGQVYDEGTEEQRALLSSVGENLKAELNCDSYIFLEYPQGHPLYEMGLEMREYWLRQFGTSRRDEPKGIALLEVA